MKKSLIIMMAILCLSIIFMELGYAQKIKAVSQPVGCMDAMIRVQADGIKQHFVSQGFVVYRDAMINMSSMEPFPIMVQLTRGQMYQVIFVGQEAASNHRLVIYDGADNKLGERFVSRSHGMEPTNFIIHEFVPDRTDMYLLTFMTRLKNRDFCGSVCIVAADRSKKQIEYKPYVP